MSRAKNAKAPPANGEVRVEKVDKIGFVYNVVTKPPAPVYGNRREPAADVAIYGNKIGPPLKDRVTSAKDIDEYIAKKKQQFNQPP